MNLYEFNQGMYAQLPSYSNEKIEEAKERILTFLQNSNSSKYFMLMNHDEKYFTMFHINEKLSTKKCANEIVEIAKELGQIKSIELAEAGNAYEFWIMLNDECKCFMLFDYTKGVID